MWNAYQQELDGEFKRLGWKYWETLKITTRLSEEIGEVSREVGHCYGGKKKRDDEHVGDLEAEIGDIIYTLSCFANGYGYDLDHTAQASIRENIIYDNLNPLSILAKLSHRIGILIGKIDLYYGNEADASKPIDPDIEIALGRVIPALALLADQTGCTLDVAFRKTIDKVLKRDKDRFPDGV